MKRNASAVWVGALKDGNGKLTTDSGILSNTPYSFKTRFENQPGTNPEELIAAAHAGCFAMALSAELEKAGFPPESIRANATVTLDRSDGGWAILESKLTAFAHVPGISRERFDEIARAAKEGCPVSKALSLKITLEAKLVGESLGSAEIPKAG